MNKLEVEDKLLTDEIDKKIEFCKAKMLEAEKTSANKLEESVNLIIQQVNKYGRCWLPISDDREFFDKLKQMLGDKGYGHHTDCGFVMFNKQIKLEHN